MRSQVSCAARVERHSRRIRLLFAFWRSATSGFGVTFPESQQTQTSSSCHLMCVCVCPITMDSSLAMVVFPPRQTPTHVVVVQCSDWQWCSAQYLLGCKPSIGVLVRHSTNRKPPREANSDTFIDTLEGLCGCSLAWCGIEVQVSRILEVMKPPSLASSYFFGN